MGNIKKVIWGVCILFALVVVWMSRFTVYHAGFPCAYKLDRFTGKVTYYNQYQEYLIEKVKP